ncbi:hypothetical protein ENSA5_52100 [Enhygromyxa salina]|uniref:Lipoprotein n=1 Tax=Enhygromyxa salina TaxID=215803 RepID=A0A2S9XGK6_9BACT|nr:hypothetical protein [Enhygromyxa salina]PRP91999.1 hypothetical protein ENSA5_52100 [Enhygromyxa salina]
MASKARLWGMVPALGLVLSLGCDDGDELRSLDASEFDERSACGDVTMVAATADGSEALLLGIEDELVARAHDQGEAVVADYELPDDRVTVRWAAGANVYQGHCGLDNGELWRLDARKDALVGHVFVRVEPTEDGALSLTAELADVVFVADDPEGGDDYELEWTRLEQPLAEG